MSLQDIYNLPLGSFNSFMKKANEINKQKNARAQGKSNVSASEFTKHLKTKKAND